MFVAAVLFAVLAAADLLDDWNDFKRRFNKLYTAQEESVRFDIFRTNMRQAAIMNRLDPGATYGITKFADLTPEEFQSRFFSRCPANDNVATSSHPLIGAPDSWDWAAKGAVTVPQDQGGCGSCWAFCTAETVAANNHIQAGEELVLLSPQQLVDCDTSNSGCNGGLEFNALEYVRKHGLEYWETYPYVGRKERCTHDDNKSVRWIKSRTMIPSAQEDQMADFLYRFGPLTVALNANSLQLYTGGVMNPDSCNKYMLNHCVMAVGYNKSASTPYWKIQNSWGTNWGEDGYFRILFGDNTCGLAQESIYMEI